MADLIKPAPWPWTPQEAESPLAEHVIFLLPMWDPLTQRELISGLKPISNLTGLTKVQTKEFGTAVDADGGTGRLSWNVGTGFPMQHTDVWSSISVFTVDDFLDENNIFSNDVNGGATSDRGFRQNTRRTGQKYIQLRSAGGNTIVESSVAVTAGNVYCTIATNDGAGTPTQTQSLYDLSGHSLIDERRTGTSTNQSGNPFRMDYGGASYSDTNDMPNGRFPFFAILDIELEGDELRYIISHPYDLIKPRVRRVYFLAGTGAGPTIKSVSDSGSGNDTVAITASVPVAETGGGADAPSITADVNVPEAGAGADAISVSNLLGIADAGGGADAIDVPDVGVAVSDAGAGADSPTPSAQVPVSDSGSGADAPSISVQVDVTETGTGTDAVSVLTEILKTVNDVGGGADSVLVAVEAVVSDVGSGTDSPSIAVSFTLGDSGTGAETISVGAAISIADAGVGTDAINVTVDGILKQIFDTALGTDAVANIQAAVTVVDLGAGADGVAEVLVDVSLADAGVGTDAVTATNLSQLLVDEIKLRVQLNPSVKLRVQLNPSLKLRL